MSLRIELSPGRFRVSKPTFDARTATASQLIFSEGVSGVAPGLIATLAVSAQSIAYVPIPDPGNVPLFYWKLLGGNSYPTIFVDASKTVVGVQNPSTNQTITIKYYLFKARSMQ